MGERSKEFNEKIRAAFDGIENAVRLHIKL
jgi:hypothetical protein